MTQDDKTTVVFAYDECEAEYFPDDPPETEFHGAHAHTVTRRRRGELVATAGFVIVSRFENETIDGEDVYNRTTTTQCRHLSGTEDDYEEGPTDGTA